MSETTIAPLEQRWPVTPFIQWIMEQEGPKGYLDLEYCFVHHRYGEFGGRHNVPTPPERFGENYRASPLGLYISSHYEAMTSIDLGDVQEFLESLYGHGFL